jgi:hypothetical protein
VAKAVMAVNQLGWAAQELVIVEQMVQMGETHLPLAAGLVEHRLVGTEGQEVVALPDHQELIVTQEVVAAVLLQQA